VYGPDDPLALALLGQDVSQASIVRSPPKSKVEKEEEFSGSRRQGVKQEDLERKEAEVEDVDVRFWIRWVEERCNDIVRGRDAED
jgi:hypothetical protein